MFDADSLPSFGYIKTAILTAANKTDAFKDTFVPYFKGKEHHLEKLPYDVKNSLKTFFLLMMI